MSKVNYNLLSIEGVKKVLLEVHEACSSLGIDFFIVGAVARNIWLVLKGEKSEGTKDIDFGIYASSGEEYDMLRKFLMKKYGYQESSQNAFCLITPQKLQVDLLPFGDIEINGQVMIKGKGLTNISLDGFREAFELGVKKVKIDDDEYKACSIPAMVILKLIAYDDRPEKRMKDIKDFNTICKLYPTLEKELIWEKYNEFYKDDLEHDHVAMIALAKEMNEFLVDNKKLEKRVIKILNKALKEENSILSLMIEDPEKETIEMKAELIKLIKQGLEK